ncbi:MAG: trypsin-like serine protease [Planctomycetota bacterium]
MHSHAPSQIGQMHWMGQGANANAGVSADGGIARIVNGNQTDGFPAVGFVGPLGCTGTLISPTHVLSAAHCFEGVGNRAATFQVGGRTYQSEAVHNHPDYNPNNFSAGNDIAIITLREPVQGIAPMTLYRQSPQVGMELTLVGFGEGGTSTGGFDPNDNGKQVGQTRLDVVTDQHIAWNFDSHNEANTAPGDSGGPAFVTVDGVQSIIGVTSGGTGNAQSLGDYSFDTRIDIHADWIDGIVGGDGSGNDDPGKDDPGNDGPGNDGPGNDDPGNDDPGNDDPGTDDHADNPGRDATIINLDADGAGNDAGVFEVAGDRDAFAFSVDADGETTIALGGQNAVVDTVLRIYDADGQLIGENDDIDGGLDSRVILDLDAGLYYAVAATYNDSETGAYNLTVQHESDDTDDGGGNDGNGYGFFSNDEDYEISADGRDRVKSEINVQGLDGQIVDVNVTVDIDHSYVSDLRLVLVAPDGQRVVLVNRKGGDGDGFDETRFDSDANESINRADAPFNGTYRPARDLGRLEGSDPNGTWKLLVLDRADLDGGQLNRWDLEITTSADEGGSGRMEGSSPFSGGSDDSGGQDGDSRQRRQRWLDQIFRELRF